MADRLEEQLADALECAEAAGLVYSTHQAPRIRRRRSGKGLSYRGPDGGLLKDRAELRRIRSLAVPPAWTDVWICIEPYGHLQATGRDRRGRKQYRYHSWWREFRDESKFSSMVAFGEALPGMRQRIRADMALPGMPAEKVLATVVELLDRTLIRVGNDAYAREHGTVGLTTMGNDHVEIDGSRLRFEFRGKGGKEHVVDVRDRRLAKAVKRCRELPGYELFQYLDGDGARRAVVSADVNEYLREITGSEFTAKEFRTWAGTVLAAEALLREGDFETKKQAESAILRAIDEVAGHLGNTRAVCRKSYVHPAIIEAYADRSLFECAGEEGSGDGDGGLRAAELLALEVLRRAGPARR